MFVLFGTVQVIVLLLVGAVAEWMLMTPSHRGGPLLLARRIEVNDDRWPAVLITAAHGGVGPWLLKLINKAPSTFLEAWPEWLKVHIGGVYSTHTGTIPLADIAQTTVEAARWRCCSDLVITIRGEKKKIVFPFSTLQLGKKPPVVTHLEVCRAAERIMQLANEAKARTKPML